jgi:hypothetical protein
MRSEGLRLAVAALAACGCMVAAIAVGAPSETGAAEGDAPPRVYVVVVDGMVPSEVDAATPTLSDLKARATWYEQARAVFPGETLPNHVAMSTGMLPTRNGIIGNQWWSAKHDYAKMYMEHPGLLDADTIVTRLERTCNDRGGDIATATVMSKTYLHGVFRGEVPGRAPIPSDTAPDEPQADDPNPQREADFHWLGEPYIPQSNHAPDARTMSAFLDWMDRQPAGLPQFAFVNLGDVDRAGHIDETAAFTMGQIKPVRQGAIEDTDTQLKLLVDRLESDEAWDETALIVLSDHGMDYGTQDNDVAIAQALRDNGYSATDSNSAPDDANVVGGGGSGLVWVADPKDIAPMAAILADHPGIDFISTREGGLDTGDVPRQTTHAQIGFDHPRAPDIEVFVKPGWHVSDSVNPIPGNHAHYATQHSVLMVTGGHPAVRDIGQSIGGETVYDPGAKLFAPPAEGPGSLSVAPTVASLLGIGEPEGGYDGQSLSEALEAAALPGEPVCGEAPRGEDDGDGGGDGAGDGGGAAAGAGADAPADRGGGGEERPRTTTGMVWTTLRASRPRARPRQRLTLSGRVFADAACSGPYRVTVQRRPRRRENDAHGPVGALGTSVRVGPDGRWRLRTRATRTAEYGAVMQPTRSCAPGSEVTTAVDVAARIRVWVPKPCRAGRVVSGRVRPDQPRTRILLQRRLGGRWVSVARRRLDHHSAFGFRLPSCTGRWRIVWPRQGVISLRGVEELRLR